MLTFRPIQPSSGHEAFTIENKALVDTLIIIKIENKFMNG